MDFAKCHAILSSVRVGETQIGEALAIVRECDECDGEEATAGFMRAWVLDAEKMCRRLSTVFTASCCVRVLSPRIGSMSVKLRFSVFKLCEVEHRGEDVTDVLSPELCRDGVRRRCQAAPAVAGCPARRPPHRRPAVFALYLRAAIGCRSGAPATLSLSLSAPVLISVYKRRCQQPLLLLLSNCRPVHIARARVLCCLLLVKNKEETLK